MSNFKIKNRQLAHVSPVNNNILINSNFANPVNQRGVTAETWVSGQYGLDRWAQYNCIISGIDGGITLHGDGSGNDYQLMQTIETNALVEGEKCSFSACIDNEVFSGTTILTKDTGCTTYEDEKLRLFIYYASSKKCFCAYIRFKDTTEHTIKWAKLEIGDHATPYVPRLYGEELELCRRYYVKEMSHSIIFFTYSSEKVMHSVNLKNKMRSIPTITVESVSAFDTNNDGTIASQNEIVVNTVDLFRIISTFSGVTLKTGAGGFQVTYILDAEL